MPAQFYRVCRTRETRAGLTSLVLLAALGVVAPASAQDQPAAASTQTDQIETITVTATRQGRENIQDVPMAISALSPKMLSNLNLNSLSDFTRLAPSLSMEQSGAGFNAITIRGLAVRQMDTSETEDRSLVAVYLDDTPIGLKSGTPDLKVVDLEDVEILRGPQGTLYGAGAMAGTIRLVTKKPDLEKYSGYAELTGSETGRYGGFNHSERAAVNVPLIQDILALRISGYHDDESGYIKSLTIGGTSNSSHTTQGRVALRFTPTDDLTIDASFTIDSLRAGLDYGSAGLGPYKSVYFVQPAGNDDLKIYSLTAAYDLDFAELTSTTSYTHLNNLFLEDQSYVYHEWFFGNSGPMEAGSFIAANATRDWVEEVRLTSKEDGPWKWTGGLFYENGTRKTREDNPYTNLDALWGPVVGIPNYSSVTNDLTFEPNDGYWGLIETVNKQIAVYGQVSYSPVDGLDLTAGLRYFDWSEHYHIYSAGLEGTSPDAYAGSPYGTPLIINANPRAKGVTPRFAAEYHVDDDVNIFAEVAKGFRYGGVNQPVPPLYCGADLAANGLKEAPASFGPDKLWSYTLGEKATLFDKRLTLNVTGFYIDWTDTQTATYLDCSYYYTVNVGEVTSKGVEIEAAGKVTPYLTLQANASFNDVETAVDIPGQHAPSGTTAPFAPKYIGSLAATYDVPMGENNLEFTANYSFKSSYYNSLDHTTLHFRTLPWTTELDAAITYMIGNYEVGVFANNLTDRVNIEHNNYAPTGSLQPGDDLAYARPRTVGMRVRAGF
jgi:outer membrane receptor protein involved in Fe transport